jgi:hypothetical protein
MNDQECDLVVDIVGEAIEAVTSVEATPEARRALAG